MGSSSMNKAWMVATGVGVVEALKDQMGFCRWNYAIRSVQQQAKSNLRSISQAKNKLPSQSTAVMIREKAEEEMERMKQSEESLRKVMYLTCWGPN
ncbi:uncharacterized protein LOC124940576 [Impatiens glandulifera]|uniref:uncharacterized protein LOC124940576 n=1 Tax=Impatiens glandulifera TaxID=253017 RepID=UPI001FB0FBBB|nr:uncharacterized protein LOC124940576 [Impatiens glandulifera]